MEDINILLLGESGVGKTSFINAAINYFYNGTIENTQKTGVIVAAPTTVSVSNGKNNKSTIKVEPNKDCGPKSSNKIKEYFVNFSDARRVRFIDTAGIDDNSQTEQSNLDQIFKHVIGLKEIHGVCFFLKSSLTRLNSSFEYCVRQTLAKFGISVSSNFIFIFTHGRSAQFKPYTAKSVLTGFVDSINLKLPQVKISLKENIFCVDNEAFFHLMAVQSGYRITTELMHHCSNSWNSSFEECKRIISYVTQLTPYKIFMDETVEKIEKFMEENSMDLVYLYNSNIVNSAKSMKIKQDLDEASGIIRDLQQQFHKPYSANCSFIDNKAAKKGNSYTSSQSSFKSYRSKNASESSHNTIYTDVCSLTQDKTKGSPEKMEYETYYDANEKFNKLSTILKNPEKVVTNLQTIMDVENKEFDKLLNKVAKYALVLKNSSGVHDPFKKHICVMLDTLKDSNDAENVEKLNNLLRIYEKVKSDMSKTEAAKSPEQEISNEDIEKTVRKLQELLHHRDVLEKLLNI